MISLVGWGPKAANSMVACFLSTLVEALGSNTNTNTTITPLRGS